MFGYVRPLRDELKIGEERAYRAAYCGVCNAMGRRHGFMAQLFLSYDFAFLAMLLSPSAERPDYETCRCPARLWCRKKCCISNPGLDAAADESTILSYWKLQDTVSDGGFWVRLGAGILSLLLRRGYRKAAALRPDFDQTVCACLGELRVLERENCPSLDRPADAFARILRCAAIKSGDVTRDRAMEELLYHIGRWIYLVDAWDDLEDDRKSGSYNPISARFSGAELENREYLRTTLLHSRNLAVAAFELLPSGCWTGIVGNIIYLGLPAVETLVFSGRWNQGRPKRKWKTLGE